MVKEKEGQIWSYREIQAEGVPSAPTLPGEEAVLHPEAQVDLVFQL